MSTVVKIGLGIFVGGVLLLIGCGALIAVGTNLEPTGLEDTGLEDTGSDPSGGDEPPRSPQRTRRFSGNGTKNVGTIKVTDDAVLVWKASDDGYGNRLFAVNDRDFNLNISSEAGKGRSSLEPGTYRRVEVTSVGDWSFTVKGR